MSRNLGVEVSRGGEYYFISYNSEDQDRVAEYVQALSACGVPVWYDHGIRLSSRWEQDIADHLEHCRAVIMFISRHIFQKEQSYVRTEFRIAREDFRKEIYIVLLDEIKSSDVPNGFKFWWKELQDLQNVEAYRYSRVDPCVENLLSALGIRSDCAENEYTAAFRQFRETLGNRRLVPVDSDLQDAHAPNLYLEGDESVALSLIMDEYCKKVRLVFLDPPRRNAGGIRDSDETAAELKKMLYRNLVLSRQILTEDGILILAVDLNGLSECKQFCDEILGPDNFVGMITVEHGSSRTFSKIGTNNEYLLVYTPNSSVMKRLEDYAAAGDEYTLHDMKRKGSSFDYPVYVSGDGSQISLTPLDGKNGSLMRGPWRCSEEVFGQYLRSGELCFDGQKNRICLRRKVLRTVASNWKNPAYDAGYGGLEVKKLMGVTAPVRVRSSELTADLFRVFLPADGIVADLYSGVGASARAVLRLNREDGGSRRFLLIQDPEKLRIRQEDLPEGHPSVCSFAEEYIRRSAADFGIREPVFRIFRCE